MPCLTIGGHPQNDGTGETLTTISGRRASAVGMVNKLVTVAATYFLLGHPGKIARIDGQILGESCNFVPPTSS